MFQGKEGEEEERKKRQNEQPVIKRTWNKIALQTGISVHVQTCLTDLSAYSSRCG